MATWNNANTVLTTAGKNLLSYAQAGNGGLTITKIVPGAGRVANNLLEDQTGVSQPKPEMVIISKVSTATGTTLNVQLNTAGLTEAYELNQVGVFASNVNTGEVLYLLAQCVSGTSDTIPLPADTPTLMNFSFSLIHGSEAVVTVQVSNAGIVPADVFDAHRHPNATPSADGYMSKEDKTAHNTLVTRINQPLNTTSSPTFAAATIGAVTIAADGTIIGAKFT